MWFKKLFVPLCLVYVADCLYRQPINNLKNEASIPEQLLCRTYWVEILWKWYLFLFSYTCSSFSRSVLIFFVIYLLHKNPCQNPEQKYEFVFENYFIPLWYFVELMSKNRIVCHKIIIIERKEKVYAYANEAINSKSRFFTFSTAILSTPLAYQGLHCTLLYIQV